MPAPPLVQTARLDEDQLEDLDRRLTLAALKAEPGVHRGPRLVDGVEAEDDAEAEDDTAGDDDLEGARTEIIDATTLGVKIGSQAESHPLIALYKASKIALPPDILVDHQQLGYDFYVVEVVFSVFLATDQYPVAATFDLTIRDDAPTQARRTRPIHLFPDHMDIQYFQADLTGALGIDAGMNVSVPIQGTTLIPFAKLTGDASIKAGFVFGPRQFQFRKAAIEVQGLSDQEVSWRYNIQSVLKGTNEFKSVLVLKVAQETTQVTLDARLSVTPCKTRWLFFRDHLPALPAQGTLVVELARAGDAK